MAIQKKALKGGKKMKTGSSRTAKGNAAPRGAKTVNLKSAYFKLPAVQ